MPKRKDSKKKRNADNRSRVWATDCMTILDGITDLVVCIAKDGKILSINKAVEKILGYKKGEVLGENVFKLDILEKKAIPTLLSLLRGVEKRGRIKRVVDPKTNSMELTLNRKNGSMVHVEANTKIIKRNGKVEGFLSVLRDITDRKKLQEAIKESEEKFRQLVENIDDIIYSTDKNGVLTYISPRVEKVLGYRPEEIIGQPYTKFLANEDLQCIEGKFQKVIEGVLEPSEYRLISKSGKIHWVKTSSRPIYKGKEPIGLYGVLTDITKEREIYEGVIREKKVWEATFDLITDPIMISDKNRRVVRVNSAFARRLNKKFNEIIGRNCYEILFKGKKKCEECLLHPRSSVVTNITIVENLVFPGIYLVSTYVAEIENQKTVVHYFRDITQEKMAERMLRGLNWKIINVQEEERKRIAQELHDELSQTLTMLKLETSWLQTKLTGLDAETRKRLHSIIQTTDGLIDKVKNICFRLRPSTLEEVGLINALEKTVEDFTVVSGIKCQVLTRSEIENIDSQIATVAYRIISEALTNVVRHAFAREVVISIERKNEKLRIEVIDNGIGIPDDLMRFTKCLGVYGMMERARSIGGEVTIRPGPICGTIVKIILPLK